MAPAKTRKRKSGQDVPVDSSTSDDSKRQRNLPVRAKDGDSAQDVKPASAPAKGTMMVFGDEDEIPAPAPSIPAVQAPEEEESSDDEAPEAVSTAKVASDIKKSSQAAQKAAQEQAATQKRKRRERDALFKQQAEERKKVEVEAEAAADGTPAEQAEPAVQKRQPAKMPNLLPAEFLTDSSSEGEDAGEDDQAAAAAARPRKRRVTAVERTLARQSRGPRDERVGSTVYRVAKEVDERMAPKLRKHARSSKELLLKRNRSAAKPRSGFLVR